MSDYTLTDNDDVTISSNIEIDNFIYRGGKIKILPSYEFTMNGEFIFSPTTSENPQGHIHGAYVARMNLECGQNGFFEKFHIYDLYPDRHPLWFPCMVFDAGEEVEDAEAFFGGEVMHQTALSLDLAFKEKYTFEVSGDRLEEKDLAEYYLHVARDILNDIVYSSDYINVGKVGIQDSIQEPRKSRQSLFGFTMELYVAFRIDE